MKNHLCIATLLVIMTSIVYGDPPPNTYGITALTPPYLETNPGPTYWPRVRMWQGVPGIAQAPNGRLWACWYAGLLGEGKGQNYCLLVTSEDDGKTWSKPVVVYDPSRQLLGGDVDAGTVWMDPKGKMWWILNRVMNAPGDSIRTAWGFVTENPGDAKPTWKGPVFLGYGLALNKPLVTSAGEWLFNVDFGYDFKPGDPRRKDPRLNKGAHLYRFSDYDSPLEHVGYCDIKDAIFAEHMLIERKDKSLWMMARTKYGIAQAESKDGAKTWTEIEPFATTFNKNVRFYFRRLSSGNLLLIFCDDADKRAMLTAMLSKDEGKTWPYKLLLDERNPVGYPDGFQDDKGFIYVTYDHGRYLKDMQELLMVKITEADIEAGKLVNPESRLKGSINRLADEGGGVHYDGETWDMRLQFEKMNEGNTEVKKNMQLLDGEKAEKDNKEKP